MVKHHKKSKTSANSSSKAKKVEERDMNEFAGSSDDDSDTNANEEANHDSDDDVSVDGSASTVPLDNDSDSGSADGDGDGDEEGGVSEVVIDGSSSNGLSSAISRILSSSTKTLSKQSASKKSLVLSKTVTKHQKALKEEDDKVKGAGKARSLKRSANLSSMYIPTLTSSSSTHTKVLTRERDLRRVATRGVVALFNAIATHQHSAKRVKEGKDDGSEGVEDGKKETFINKIKESAGGGSKEDQNINDGGSGGKEKAASKSKSAAKKAEEPAPMVTSGSKWLSAAYGMNKSKLQDWDNDGSDNSDDDNNSITPDFVKEGDYDLEDGKEYDEAKEREEKKRKADESRERGGKKRYVRKKT
jgi:hypothetical protein